MRWETLLTPFLFVLLFAPAARSAPTALTNVTTFAETSEFGSGLYIANVSNQGERITAVALWGGSRLAIALSDGGTSVNGKYFPAQGRLEVWELSPPRKVSQFALGDCFIRSLAFTGPDTVVAGDSSRRTVYRFDLATGKVLDTLTDKANGWALVAAATPDTDRLVVRRPSGEIVERKLEWPQTWPQTLIFSPRGDSLAILTRGVISLFDPLSAKPLPALQPEIQGANDLYGAAYSPDGRRLAMGTWNRVARYDFAAKSTEIVSTFGIQTPSVLAYDPRGEYLIYGGAQHWKSGNFIELWPFGAKDARQLYGLPNDERPLAIYFLDARRLLVASDKAVRIGQLVEASAEAR